LLACALSSAVKRCRGDEMRKLPHLPQTNRRRDYRPLAKLFRKLVAPVKDMNAKAYLLAGYLSKVELREVMR
jgi:hypothetical protein